MLNYFENDGVEIAWWKLIRDLSVTMQKIEQEPPNSRISIILNR